MIALVILRNKRYAAFVRSSQKTRGLCIIYSDSIFITDRRGSVISMLNRLGIKNTWSATHKVDIRLRRD
eukprot:XP_001704742.1 Hypothetical protein GL50803_36351 [Giardia lamblia ATCC 50803]